MTIHQTIALQSAETNSECITIIARNPGQAIAEFHRRGLGKEGFAICGRIVPHKFEIITENGETEALFEGDHFYSATFIRQPEGHNGPHADI